MNTFLAVDYGDRRVGLAVGHADVSMAFPRETIDRKKSADFIAEILDYAKTERADALVVGLPVHPEGKENDKSADVLVFIETLKTRCDIPIFTQNEAWSSEIAKSRTAHLKTKQKKQDKGRIDRAAAAVFLQEFLEEKSWL
jgi:putative Holliday junction resolvase